MKKLILAVAMAIFSITMVSAKDGFGDFSLPHTSSVEILQQYIGQHVMMLDHKRVSYMERESFKRSGFKLNYAYKIVGVKVTKKYIFLSLEDKSGYVAKLKICNTGYDGYYVMDNCSSLFLVDKYNQYEADFIKEHTNKEIYNTKKEKVAIIKSIVFPKEIDDWSDNLKTPTATIESLLDVTTFDYSATRYEKFTNNF